MTRHHLIHLNKAGIISGRGSPVFFPSLFRMRDSGQNRFSEDRRKSTLHYLIAFAIAFVLLASALGYLVSGSIGLAQEVQKVPASLKLSPASGSQKSPVASSYATYANTLPSSDPGRIIKAMNFSATGVIYPVPIQGVYDPATGLIYSGAIRYTSPFPFYLIEANVSNVSLPVANIPLSYPGYVESLDSSNGNLTVVESNHEYAFNHASDFVQQVDPVTGSLSPALNMSFSTGVGWPAAALNDPVNGLVYILTILSNYGYSNLSVYDPQTNLILTTSLVKMYESGFYPSSMAFNSNYSRLFVFGSYIYASFSYQFAAFAINMSNYSSYLIKTPITFATSAQNPGGIAYDPYTETMYFSYSSSTLTNSTGALYSTEGVGMINATTESYVLNFSLPDVYVGIAVSSYVAGSLTYDPNNNDLYLTQSGLPWQAPSNERFVVNNTIAVINGTSPTSANPVALLSGVDYPIGGLFVPSQSAGDGSLWFPSYNSGANGPYGGFMVAGIPPAVNSFKVTPSVIDEGASVTLNSSVSFGVGALNYSYSGLPSGMASENLSLYSGTPTANGTYTVRLKVTDAAGESSSASVLLTVNSPLGARVHSSPASVDSGQIVQFSVSVSGGTSPYTEQWAFGDGGSGSGTSPSHVYIASGQYTVAVTVKDAVGSTYTATFNQSVSLPPSNLSISVSRNVVDAGVPVTFSAEEQYGSSPLTYRWSMGDGTTSSTSTFTHAYAAKGNYTVILTVSDATGISSSTSYSIIVLPDPHANIVLSPSTVTAGTSFTIGSNVTGGLGPYTYDWNFGDGTQSSQPDPQHSYAKTGTFTVTLKVTDAAGYTTTSQFNVTVANSSSTGGNGAGQAPSSSQSYLMLGGGLAAGIVIGAVVGVVMASRRRKPPASQ